MELLKDFPIDKYLSKKPPSQNGNTTKNEVAELTKIPMRKKFIEEKDDIHASFKKIVGNDPIIDKLVEESAPIILKIKKHHDSTCLSVRPLCSGCFDSFCFIR
mgnify:CR=1 FL=1